MSMKAVDPDDIEALDGALMRAIENRAHLGPALHLAVLAHVVGRVIERGVAEGCEAQALLGLVARNVAQGRAAAKAASGRAKALEERRVTGASGQADNSGGAA